MFSLTCRKGRQCLLLFLCLGGFQAHSAGAYQLQPIKTSYGKILTEATINLSYESFKGVELDEVDEFDGWTAAVDFTLPFKDRFQLHFSVPFRTEGDAVISDDQWFMPGMPIDVEGNGGVFDFVTLTFEHQLRFEQEHDYNLSYYIGGGSVAYPLETNMPRPTGGYDFINHNGAVFMGGIKVDDERWGGRVLGNVGLRAYARSDDLNPGNSDQLYVLDLKTAMIFKPWLNRVYPVVEFTYLGNFSGMNQVTLVPELIVPVNNHFELKAGLSIGLGGNGSESGAYAEMTARF